MDKNKRLAYSTESPYTTVEWPVLPGDQEADIVALLCRLLEPVGTYRREHIKPSKGKSSRKRQRKRSLVQSGAAATDSRAVPPPPDIFSHVTLGFNTTIRYLELLSAASRPPLLGEALFDHDGPAAKSAEPVAPLCAVFVCRTGLPSILVSSLPLLAATASLAFPAEPPIRLVPLGKIAGDKLAETLHQPRVGFIGLRSDASAAGNLIDLVRTRVQPVQVPWLKEAASGTYLPVKIRQTEVKVGPKTERAVDSLCDEEGSK